MLFRARFEAKHQTSPNVWSTFIYPGSVYHTLELPEISIVDPETKLSTSPGTPTNRFDSTSTGADYAIYQELQAACQGKTHSYNVGYYIGEKLGAFDRSYEYEAQQYYLYLTDYNGAGPHFFFGTNNGLRYQKSHLLQYSSYLNSSGFIMGGENLSFFKYFFVYIIPSTNPNANYHWVVWRYRTKSNDVEYFYTYCCFESTHATLTPEWWTGFNETMAANVPDPISPFPDLPPSEGGDEISEGTFDWTSDDLPDPPALTYSAVDTGFTRIYNPTLAQLQDFARYMWTDTNIFNTVWSIIARYFEDPMDAFISLSLLPIAIPNTTDPITVKMLFLSTGKSMYAATQQFVTVECGLVNLREIYGSALDYSPNTKIDLFLPYIGTVPIDPDEVMNREIKLTYKVDICTGCCVAIVSVKLPKSDGTEAYYPLYQFSGNCAIQIPFTSSNMDRYIDATIKAATIALTAGAGVAAGAAGAAAAKADTIAAAASSNTAYAGASLASAPEPQFSGPTAGIDKGTYKLAKADAAGFNRLSTALRGASEGIGIITGAKPQFSHSAPFTANSGYMSYRVPFFIIKSPRLVNPDQYGKYNGYPSLTHQQFSGLTGYTEVQQVQLTNINATANELDEIQGLLKTGVIM